MTFGHYFARDTLNRDHFIEISLWGLNNWRDEATYNGHRVENGRERPDVAPGKKKLSYLDAREYAGIGIELPQRSSPCRPSAPPLRTRRSPATASVCWRPRRNWMRRRRPWTLSTRAGQSWKRSKIKDATSARRLYAPLPIFTCAPPARIANCALVCAGSLSWAEAEPR